MVVLTRERTDNERLASALVAVGCEPLQVPLTEVVDAADGGVALRAALQRLDRYGLVTFTSANGVKAVAEVLNGRDWPRGVAVAVVGPATARAVEAVGWPVDVMPDRATAAALVETIDPASTSGPVLAPLAAAAADTIEMGLTGKGFVVDRIEAYRTTAPDQPRLENLIARLDETLYDARGAIQVSAAITFFAPSTVDRWVDLIDRPPPPIVVCIGPSTAERAQQRGMVGIRTADPHTEAGVLARIQAETGLYR